MVEYKEFKRYSDSPLEVKDGRFWQDGREVVLHGAVANHFFYGEQKRNSARRNFSKDLGLIKMMGGNYVDIFLNMSFFDDPNYMRDLAEGIRRAKDLGLFVKLTLHSRGTDRNDEPLATVVDSQLIIDTEKLFSNPEIKRVANLVDIFNPLSEPAKSPDGSSIQWSQSKPILQQAIIKAREIIGREILSFYSGIDWAGNGLPLYDDPITLPNTAIEIHPYQYSMDGTRKHANKPNIDQYIGKISKTGIPLMVGEMGYNDKPFSIDDQLRIINENKISFAFYAVNTTFTDRGYAWNSRGRTLQGDLAMYYYGLVRKTR